MAAEPLAAKIGLFQFPVLDHRSHRAVKDENSLGQQVLEKFDFSGVSKGFGDHDFTADSDNTDLKMMKALIIKLYQYVKDLNNTFELPQHQRKQYLENLISKFKSNKNLRNKMAVIIALNRDNKLTQKNYQKVVQSNNKVNNKTNNKVNNKNNNKVNNTQNMMNNLGNVLGKDFKNIEDIFNNVNKSNFQSFAFFFLI